MRKVMFTVPGKITGKERPRFTGHGAHTPEKTKAYEEVVGYTYKAEKGRMMAGPVYVEIEAFFRKPKTEPKDQYPTKKPDIDNIVKIICDGLNGVAYKDDAQVVGLIARKYWTDGEERVRITIEEMEKNKC